MNATAARRFYAMAEAFAEPGGYGVKLDSRELKTPRGRVFRTPSLALAQACAREWEAQADTIKPENMPFTQLAFAALDETPRRRADLAPTLAKYLETDLVAHRAEAPAELVARQSQIWDPIVAWGEARFDISVPVVMGLIAAGVSAADRARVIEHIEGLDDFSVTALAQAVTTAGSALIGLALLERRLDAEAAFTAAALDDLWSLERWGEDEAARARLERQREAFQVLDRFVVALSEA
jgi:chaperone required for assembly of F1-ATPase